MSQLCDTAGMAGKHWQWWGLDITLQQTAVSSVCSSCYIHGDIQPRCMGLATAWWLFPIAPQLGKFVPA